jgi:hypothetical protein
MRFPSFVPPQENKQKCKEKGITLNYKNSKVQNFSALSRLIMEDKKPLHVHNTKKSREKTVVF